MEGQRLDKWLWCTRLVKTRTLSAALIAAGKVRVNGERMLKPGRRVQPGDVVTAAGAGRLVVVRVIGAVDKRTSPSLAKELYEDLSPPDADAANGKNFAARTGRRPTKRDRRRIDALKGDEAGADAPGSRSR